MLGQVGKDSDGKNYIKHAKVYISTDCINEVDGADTGMAYIILNEATKENEIVIVGGANMAFAKPNVYFLPANWMNSLEKA